MCAYKEKNKKTRIVSYKSIQLIEKRWPNKIINNKLYFFMMIGRLKKTVHEFEYSELFPYGIYCNNHWSAARKGDLEN